MLLGQQIIMHQCLFGRRVGRHSPSSHGPSLVPVRQRRTKDLEVCNRPVGKDLIERESFE